VITQEISARNDAFFPPDSTGVVYTEMVPRRVWADPQTHRNECEGGLLLLDFDSRVVKFEGDRYRYVVPAESIVRCTVEEVVMGNVEKGTTAAFFAVVLVVRTADGDRELPLCPLSGVPGGNRWEKATALYDLFGPLLTDLVPLTAVPRHPHVAMV
jgi:hypothetical protein